MFVDPRWALVLRGPTSIKKCYLDEKMFKGLKSSLPVFWRLLYVDLLIFKPMYSGRLIDYFIYVSLMVLIMGYLLTGFGVRPDFGMFTAATLVGTSGMFDVFPRAVAIVSDLTGSLVISYDLTLPISCWLAIVRMGISNAIRCVSLSIFALPFGLLFVYPQFNSAHVSWGWFFALLVSNALIYGFFSIFLSSVIENMSKIGSMWIRVVFPLWMLGGFQFTWEMMYAKSPLLAYVLLLNPFLYTTEGMRGAILGQAGSLPTAMCFFAGLFFAGLYGSIGVLRLLRRLDAVR